MAETIQQTIDELRKTLTDYIEATYHIGDPGLVKQRQRLLSEVGGIFQIPYLESTPRYVASARYEELDGLPDAARDALLRLSDPAFGKAVIFNPPYAHQAQAIVETLVNRKNLMIMTGTGSGKTESFLLPILGKLAIEARENAKQFENHHAIRAIVLYPMNALVNDQLGRLRQLFGNSRVISMFEEWAGRPARFARYTSRTPYAGVRSVNKDGRRLSSIDDFFVAIEDGALRHERGHPQNPEEDERAFELRNKLLKRGKWPAKQSIAEWYGAPHKPWRDRKGTFQRAVTLPHDAELLTRHEIQESPPDLLITNYSMLEYMMMRPIERPIFDKTRAWLEACPDEKIMVVLDEAHLYRGAQGAEVGLLLRRLRERLGITADRFQVICATASFSEEGKANAGRFGAELTGVPKDTFVSVTGTLALRMPEGPGTVADLNALNQIDLDSFYSSDASAQNASVVPFLQYRSQAKSETLGNALVLALEYFPPFNLLVNETMKAALPLDQLGAVIFPDAGQAEADRGITRLLALGSRARRNADEPSLLPCRIHSFFRGLPGLWACLDPDCSELPSSERGGPTGKLYNQPHERCGCGAPVLEYFTCRYCGTSYARAYTDNVRSPHLLWAEAGHSVLTDTAYVEAYEPLDLLLEEPPNDKAGMPAEYDLITGMLNPAIQSPKRRIVFLRPEDSNQAAPKEEKSSRLHDGTFVPCACCGKQYIYGQSSVQDHQTKGDQPFQAILGTQIKVQPPGPQSSTDFAPLRGRKVLVFSDSRQVAARLAPTLQNYSLRDTVRALIPVGFDILSKDQNFSNVLVLDHAFLAVITAAHKLGVRVRPEFARGESMPRIDSVPTGQVPTGAELIQLMTANCPVNLMRAILDAISHKELGLESLALATIRESKRLTPKLTSLPDLPGVAEDSATKLAVARAWIRCWVRGPGLWFNTMQPTWWGVEVSSHRGTFEDMNHILITKQSKSVFSKSWLPNLALNFTQRLDDGGMRILASNLSLEIGGIWQRCPLCKSIHRPIGKLTHCIDCESEGVQVFNPDLDSVFTARRGFYRSPIVTALQSDEPSLLSLIAAEHTAQLNAAQPEEAFSQAENHEIRFQDIDVAWRDIDPREPAIDVLSSTTTMEVGIDIGELSGVALRNMPPGRANYQQRSGRAGRRGNAVATVVAFGSSDSHDDHYFTSPHEMIRGSVIDPRLTLENAHIARRHLNAYLLQRYHESRLPDVDPAADPNLFSVLGRVRDFRDGTGLINRADLIAWLTENQAELSDAAARWLPTELSSEDREGLIKSMCSNLIVAVDGAIGFIQAAADTTAETSGATVEPPGDDEDEGDNKDSEGAAIDDDDGFVDPAADKLLDRLLYWGVLPRYAFPTDVAPFYVFNRALSSPYRPKMEFAPSQGLNVALSQYAPNKQIWIKNKQYTSKAIYSPYRNDRKNAWGKRRLYFECSRCGHAKTEDYVDERRNALLSCEACQSPASFGPAMPWFRPPGFAHPIDRDPVTAPDAPNETAYATRAKLIMQTPAPNGGWLNIGDRIRGFPTREHLLVSNSGPNEDGYNYCVACGRIETVSDPEMNLFQSHQRPFPNNEVDPCPGRVANRVVLGTDFLTDIALFSLPLSSPFQARPGNDATSATLRTVCEAVAKAACRLLEIESGEILAEYRPSLTAAGANGLEIEIFIYDTLAGGAGFSPQLVSRGTALFAETLNILSSCPSQCDASCYRCLRSFRNKLEHRLLDRHLGEQFLRHALWGGYPPYPPQRVRSSLDILFDDLTRQFSSSHEIRRNVHQVIDGKTVTIPVLVKNLRSNGEAWVALSSPIAPAVPVHDDLRSSNLVNHPIVCVDDLLIRRHLPRAVSVIIQAAV
jgi:ATP-dependent helicase YprA (DUF1998 family)